MFPVLPLLNSVSAESIDKFSVVGQVLVAADQDLVKVASDIKANFTGIKAISVLVKSEAPADALISLLDAGAYQVFVTSQSAAQLAEAGVDASRIVVVDDQNESYAGVFLTSAQPDSVSEYASKLGKQLLANGGAKQLYVLQNEVSKGLGAAVQVVPEDKLSSDSLAEAFIERLSTDREDKLYTTLVVDEDEKALGVVYSSDESIKVALNTRNGVYQSRKRGLWVKGATSGATQKLVQLDMDCDSDCVKFTVSQTDGFCHNNTKTCFGHYDGISSLEQTLEERLKNAPEGSYTARLFNDPKLLKAKIMEEAEELCDAQNKDEIAWEAADLIYFAMTKLVREGVSWSDVQKNLDAKARKISRRKGDAKPKWIAVDSNEKKEKAPKKKEVEAPKTGEIKMNRFNAINASPEDIEKVLTRPVQKTADIMKLVTPIIQDVQNRGDQALLDFTLKFEKAKLESPVLTAPFPEKLMQLTDEVKAAIDLSIANVEKFHAAQISDKPLQVETSPGVVCSRFARPIESVGLYVPGGTAVLPSTALMLGVPAKVAGCKNIIIATPPRSDGTPTPEIVYVAHKVGAKAIVLAGGAQAVAAMAYGTESVQKVDKIMGPGNQFVTAAKMFVQNDTRALVSIDMPAGPSEVLVIADGKANPAFVASDLLSQAEHGVDSQVILIAVDMSEEELKAVETELHNQAVELPRVDIVRGSIAHSTTLLVKTVEEAFALSNQYGPEHLILQLEDASKYVDLVDNAGSVFVGAYSPESCGDYSSGTNHTLPTYGYAKMYSGVNAGTFQKHITSQELSAEGLKNIGKAVMTLAEIEGLHAHRNAVKVRLEALQ
ncbi:hypothetical protein TRVA0_009S01904 [Trichomonascus vanleenenianus]|uniref:trifunctional histidinol dehydrogenase/phosphoribosyl-AMP cyclohydrolase/phosphoribosyl-ATP diphosphatase n=1 Tax=Trichomonascus vanleenenianus TaxID=2268995 RepID=UPI003EC96BC4